MYHGTEALPLTVLITNAIPRIFKEYHGTFQYSTTVFFELVVRSDVLGVFCTKTLMRDSNPGYPSMLYLSRVIGVIAAPGALRPGWADGRRQAKVHSAPLSPISGLVLYVSGAPGGRRWPQEGGRPRGVGSAVTLALTIGPMGPVVGQRVMSHDVLQL